MKIIYRQELPVNKKIDNIEIGDILVDDCDDLFLIIKEIDNTIRLFEIQTNFLQDLKHDNIDNLKEDIFSGKTPLIMDVIKKNRFSLAVE
jgi:hypothetical protein